MTDSQTISPSQECITEPNSIGISATQIKYSRIQKNNYPEPALGGRMTAGSLRDLQQKNFVSSFYILAPHPRWKILTTTATTETSPVGTRSITTTTERHFVVIRVIDLYKAGEVFAWWKLEAVKCRLRAEPARDLCFTALTKSQFSPPRGVYMFKVPVHIFIPLRHCFKGF